MATVAKVITVLVFLSVMDIALIIISLVHCRPRAKTVPSALHLTACRYLYHTQIFVSANSRFVSQK